MIPERLVRRLLRMECGWKQLGVCVAALALTVGVLIDVVMSGGPNTPLLCGLTRHYLFCPRAVIFGRVAPAFAEVEEGFREHFRLGMESSAQLSIWHKNEHVVDLWGTLDAPPHSAYHNGSLQRVFSCTKMLESLAVAIAADRGWLEYDKSIASYWPEFGQHDKDRITVEELMKHEAGLAVMHPSLSNDTLLSYAEGDPEPLAKYVESQTPEWPNNSRCAYHVLTRGFVVAELIRRVDPQQRLIHHFLEQEILQPLKLDWHFLLSPEQRKLVMPNQAVPQRWLFVHVLLPYWFGRLFPFLPHMDEHLRIFMTGAMDVKSIAARMGKVIAFADGTPNAWNAEHTYRYVISSASSLATGHALARLANAMANGGELDGVSILSPAGFAAATQCGHPASMDDQPLCMGFRFSRAGFGCNMVRNSRYDEHWMGWGGWGGSIILWDTKRQAGLGYAMTSGVHLADPRVQKFISTFDAAISKHDQ